MEMWREDWQGSEDFARERLMAPPYKQVKVLSPAIACGCIIPDWMADFSYVLLQ